MKVYYKHSNHYRKLSYVYTNVEYCCDKMKEASTVDISRGFFFCGDVEWDYDDGTIYFDTASGEYGTRLTNVKFCPFCGTKIEMRRLEEDES